MMFNVLPIATFILASISAVSPLVIPRYSPGLENYSTYHERYMALGCENKHGTTFFNTCCHPLKAGQSPSSLSQECTPSGGAAAPPPVPTLKHAPAGNLGGTSGSSDSALNQGGFATFFFQNGNAGACGKVHSDSDLICAMDQARYGNSGNSSPLCGKQVQITNKKSGKMVTVTVADDCPTCVNSNSIDLSTGAFNRIADPSEGIVPIEWKFV